VTSLRATLEPRELLRRMFDAAIDSARPDRCLPAWLPEPPNGRTIVVGAGKASAAMARTLEAHWRGPLSGLVVTRYGHAVDCRHIEVVEAAHPVPDQAGMSAAQRMLHMVSGLNAHDLVIALVSGGGSALLPLPARGIALSDKQALSRELLRCGATIREINCVRRHLSAIKGGRLAAAAHPARVVTLLISDVAGDDPVDIASGPTVGDPSTCRDALDILARHAIAVSPVVRHHLESGAGETVKPDDPRLAHSESRLVATPMLALEAAATAARVCGVHPLILSDAIEGEAREVGTVLAALARHSSRHGQPAAAPCVLLSGGETTVTVRNQGRGGRNVEFLLSLAVGLDGLQGVWALAGDTDGVDGTEATAGAIVTPDTLARARVREMRPLDFLDRNDAHSFFSALGDEIVTGPTLTNVNDFRAILVV